MAPTGRPGRRHRRRSGRLDRPPPGQGGGDRRRRRRRARPGPARCPTGPRSRWSPPTSERGLYTIRHSTAHVLAQAVLDLFPGADLRHRSRRWRTASTTTSSCPAGARSRPTTSSASTPACARSSPRRQPFLRREVSVAEGLEHLRRPPLQDRDHRRHGRGPDVGHRVGHGAPLRQPARLHRPVPGPARARHRPLPRPLQAHAGGRRLLAGRRDATRCCSASTARRGRPRRSSTTTSTVLEEAAEARPPPARRRARPAVVPRRARRRPGRVAPQGRDRSAS